MRDKILRTLAKKKIVVLKGGWSSEREISLKSGKNIENALEKSGLKVVGLDLSPEQNQSTKQKVLCSAEHTNVCSGFAQVLEKLKKIKPDICFIALHGSPGEDGTIQATLELLKIPYTGSGVLASALSLNKRFSKIIFEKFNIPTPKWFSVKDSLVSTTFLRKMALAKDFDFPLVVKPTSQGSTIGVSIVKNQKELKDAKILAFKYDKEIIIEQYIKGKEIAVGILEDKSLPIIEIIPVGSSFYDYRAKYQKGGSKHIIPARIPKKTYSQAQKLAVAAHKALGCECFSRVDMRLREDGKVFILEVNTIPGMTKTSLLPEAAKFVGIDFQEMILRILAWGNKRANLLFLNQKKIK